VDEQEDDDEEKEEAEPRDQRAHAPGASPNGGSEAVRPHILPPGARSEPPRGCARGHPGGSRITLSSIMMSRCNKRRRQALLQVS